jgi:heme A synthase
MRVLQAYVSLIAFIWYTSVTWDGQRSAKDGHHHCPRTIKPQLLRWTSWSTAIMVSLVEGAAGVGEERASLSG